MMTNYYLFDTGGPDEFPFIDEWPVDSDGNELPTQCGEFSHAHTLLIKSSRSTPDIIRTMGAFRLFSKQAWGFILRLNLDPTLRVTPVAVTTKSNTRGYIAISGFTKEVLDLERAEYRWRVPEMKIIFAEISKLVLDPEKIPPFDFFKGDNGSWIVTNKFRNLWLENEFTGVEFTAIED